MKHFCLMAIAIITLSSCNSRIPSVPTEHFEKCVKITPSKVIPLEDFGILAPATVVKYKNWYVFRESSNTQDCCVKFVATDLSNSISGVSQGNGPLEVVGRFGIAAGDSLYLVDYNHRKLMTLDIERDSIMVNVSTNDCQVSSTALLYEDKLFIEPARYDSCFIKMIDVYGNCYNKIPYPQNVSLANYAYMAQNSIYMNTAIAISPDKSMFAYGVSYASIYGFGTICNRKIEVNTSFEYSPMKIGEISDLPNDVLRLVPDHESEKNAISAVGTDEYAVFVYSGRKYNDTKNFGGTNLLLYKWDGTPYLRMEIEDNVTSICYDKDRNVIAGISYSPEAQLVEYNLNEILLKNQENHN